MKFVLAGGLDSALTHFAMIGLAGILQEAGAEHVRLWWQEAEIAEPTLSWYGPDIGVAVQNHAQRHSNPDSWVQAKTPESQAGLFSPRQTSPETVEGWAALEAARESFLSLDLTPLDHQMIANLGEPGYWVYKEREGRPDHSASRWEMKTRNRGEEFMARRLAPLAKALSNREPALSVAGLHGDSLVDELGGNKPGSRTSTGLTPPGPVDTALAWCGLWGISGFTLIPAKSEVSATAGAQPLLRLHPQKLRIPVVDTPTSPSVWRALMASRAVIDTSSPDMVRNRVATRYLRSFGVAGISIFPVHTTDNPNAPERMILTGSFHPIDEVPHE